MKNLVIPDYDNSVMNITTTILKHYGVKTQYASIDLLEKELTKGYRNVVLILIDALGSEILKKHPLEAKYLIENQKRVLTTVFPSTTTSATTSVLTGIPPLESGWIGWLQHIKEEDRSVIFFLNKDFYDENHEFTYNVSQKYAPVKRIYTKIQESSPNVITKEIFPEFAVPEHKTFKDILNTTLKTTEEDGEHFIYVYWDKMDTYLHKYGTESETVKNHMVEINRDMQEFINELGEDTLVLVTADHGQIDIEEVDLWKYESITETFEHKPSIEARATAFFIKDDMEEQFVSEFNKAFRDQFVLYKSEDFLKAEFLGDGEEHPKLKEFLGDYFSVAIDKYCFKLLGGKRAFMAQHAGLTKDEMLVPLIILTKK